MERQVSSMDASMSASPLPQVKSIGPRETLDFYAAVKEVVSGKKVARKEWEEVCFCFLKEDILCIYRDGRDHQWIINLGDLGAKDWFVFG